MDPKTKTKTTPQTPQIMTVLDLASYLNAHPSTIYRMLRGGKGPPAFRVGFDWRFRRLAIDEWIILQEGEGNFHAKTLG